MILLLKMISRLVAALPLSGALALGRGLGSVVRHRRSVVKQNLARCFPEKSAAERRSIARAMYKNFGMTAMECLRFGYADLDEVESFVRWEGEHYLKEALSQGRGVLVLSGHIGNWELLGTSTSLHGYPFAVVAKPFSNAKFNAYWNDLRKGLRVRHLPARNSYRSCLKALKNGEAVVLMLDQRMRKQKGIIVDFFGRPACTSPGLAYLAAQSGAPIIPAFAPRQADNSHVVKIYPPLEPPPNRDEETIRKATQQYTRIIEDEIRKNPAQWIWLHKRWKGQPEP